MFSGMNQPWSDKTRREMFEAGATDIKMLAELLKEESDTSDDEDLPNAGLRKLGPGDVKPKIKIRVRGNQCEDANKRETDKKEDPKAIWRLDEVEEIQCTDDVLYDPRQEPQYHINYRQNVTTQDIYLQMGNKTPMTSSCEIMTIVVKLSGETKDNVDCNLSRTELDVRTPRYRLHLPLPHPVEADSSQATWSSKEESLTLTLNLSRELDFANF